MITRNGLVSIVAVLAGAVATGAHFQPRGYQSQCNEAVESLRKEAGDICVNLDDAYQRKKKAEKRNNITATFSADREMRLYEGRLVSIKDERDEILGQIKGCDASCEQWVCGGRYENDAYSFRAIPDCTCNSQD